MGEGLGVRARRRRRQHPSRICYDLLAEGYGCHLSVGTLVAWIQQSGQALAPVEEQAPVLHSDETGVRRAGHLAWAHVTSTSRLTH